MNSYPFLDNKDRPIFTGELRDITPRVRRNRIIDVSKSPLVPAKDLRCKLEGLHMAGELDGGLPIVKNGILVGLIPAPDLEFALDKLEKEESTLCLMTTGGNWSGSEDEEVQAADPTDFGPYIDPVSCSPKKVPASNQACGWLTENEMIGTSYFRHPLSNGLSI